MHFCGYERFTDVCSNYVLLDISGVEDSVIMDYLQQTDLMRLYNRLGDLDVQVDWNWLVPEDIM